MTGKFYDNDGYTEIFAKDFGNIFAAATFARKIFIQNDKSLPTTVVTGKITQFSDSDGYTMLKWAVCPNTLSPPFNVTVVPAPTGLLTVGKTYYYKIIDGNIIGETTGSLEVSYAVTGSVNRAVVLSWDEVPSPVGVYAVTGYKVFRSENRDYTTNALLQVIAVTGVFTFTDKGDLTPAPSGIPTANTTAGASPNYGTAPTLVAGDIMVNVLQPGQQKAIWVGVVSTLSTLEEDNPRNAIVTFPES